MEYRIFYDKYPQIYIADIDLGVSVFAFSFSQQYHLKASIYLF